MWEFEEFKGFEKFEGSQEGLGRRISFAAVLPALERCPDSMD